MNETILILFLVSGYLLKRVVDKKRKLRSVQAEDNASREKSEQEVGQELERIKSILSKSALGYYIDVYYRKYNISDDDLQKIQEQYPQVLAKPFIDWTKVDTSGDKSYILEEKLRAILNANKSTSSFKLKSDFAESILKDSEKEAKSILESAKIKV